MIHTTTIFNYTSKHLSTSAIEIFVLRRVFASGDFLVHALLQPTAVVPRYCCMYLFPVFGCFEPLKAFPLLYTHAKLELKAAPPGQAVPPKTRTRYVLGGRRRGPVAKNNSTNKKRNPDDDRLARNRRKYVKVGVRTSRKRTCTV